MNYNKYRRNDNDIEITDNNFLKLVGETIVYLKNKYQKDSNEQKEESSNVENPQVKPINKFIDIEKDDKFKPTAMRKFALLKKQLIFLRDNKISLADYMKKNPINFKPFQLKESIQFFEHVKDNETEKIENMLNMNKDLLFCYDYFEQTAFHWAAKRNYIDAMKIMLKFGENINLPDSNRMTPLGYAAKNNHYEMVQLLCEHGANPLMKNIDNKRPINLTSDYRIKSYLRLLEDNFPKGLAKCFKKK